MEDGRLDELQRRMAEPFFRHWRWIIVAAWLLYIAWKIFERWGPIQAFALGDTDDNLRLAQVRALLGGQGWYDLIQHRFDPVHGVATIRRGPRSMKVKTMPLGCR